MRINKLAHLGVYASMALIGVLFIGPALDTFATWAVKASNERHWVESPISDFLELDGVIAYDINEDSDFQELRTIGTVYEPIKATGPHEMKCLVNGTIGENGYVEPGDEDIEIYTKTWDEPWSYEPKKSQKRGVWTIDIDNDRLSRCPTKQIYWVIFITPIMPNGYERDAIILTSTVADIEPTP